MKAFMNMWGRRVIAGLLAIVMLSGMILPARATENQTEEELDASLLTEIDAVSYTHLTLPTKA